MLVACALTAFRWAKSLVERQRRLGALERQEQYHLQQAERHAELSRYYGSPAHTRFRLHRYESLSHFAAFRLACDEQRMLRTGKGFWELYNIKEWAALMRGMEKARAPALPYMWARIPDAAKPPLGKLVREMRWAEQRVEAKAYCDAQPRRSHAEELADYVRFVKEANAYARTHALIA